MERSHAQEDGEGGEMNSLPLALDICGLLVLCCIAACVDGVANWSFEKSMLVSILWFAAKATHNNKEGK